MFSCVSLVCSQSHCIIYNNDGKPLDISVLAYNPSKPSPPGYSYNLTVDGTYINSYFVNFCAPVSTSLGCSKSGSSGACEISTGTVYSAGLVATMQNASYSKFEKHHFEINTNK